MPLVNKHPHAYIDVDTHKNIPCLPTGSTVAMQCKVVGPWIWNCSGAQILWPQWQKLQIQGNQEGTHNCKNQRTHEEHLNNMEDCLRNKMSKTNWSQTMDKFNELVYHFAELYEHKQYKDKQMKVIGQKAPQQLAIHGTTAKEYRPQRQ